LGRNVSKRCVITDRERIPTSGNISMLDESDGFSYRNIAILDAWDGPSFRNITYQISKMVAAIGISPTK
jgi:hypothetical protein